MIDFHLNEKNISLDKRKHKDYKWDTINNTEGRLAREQIIPNRPGPSRKARNAKSIEEL